MTRYHFDKISKEAEGLADFLKYTEYWDIRKSVKLAGGRLEFIEDFIDIEIKINKKTFVIKLFKGDNKLRQNKNIACALGHLYLHLGFDFFNKKANGFMSGKVFNHFSSKEMFEADRFSLAFLLPELVFIDIVQKYTNNNLCIINEVSKYFNVSNQSVIAQGKWLGLFT